MRVRVYACVKAKKKIHRGSNGKKIGKGKVYYTRTYLMSSPLLLQQCPTCLVRLTLIVFVIGGRWPYSWCFVWCCLHDLFKIARSILI